MASADRLDMWGKKRGVGVIKRYELERVQVHRDSGVRLSYTPALLSCVTLGKLLAISEPRFPRLQKLTGL